MGKRLTLTDCDRCFSELITGPAIAENLGSVPSTHIRQLTRCKQLWSQWIWCPLLVSTGIFTHMVHKKLWQAHTQYK